MKRVVKLDTVVVNVSEINDESIVGVLWSSGNRSFVLHTKTGFVGVASTLACNYSWAKHSKQEYIKEVFHMGNENMVYLFDTVEELFKWMYAN